MIKQASELQERDLVSYSQLPNFMVADIAARLSTLSQLSLPTKALHTGFSLLNQPLAFPPLII